MTTQVKGLVIPETVMGLAIITSKFLGLSIAILDFSTPFRGVAVGTGPLLETTEERILQAPKAIMSPNEIPMIPAQTSSFLMQVNNIMEVGFIVKLSRKDRKGID